MLCFFATAYAMQPGGAATVAGHAEEVFHFFAPFRSAEFATFKRVCLMIVLGIAVMGLLYALMQVLTAVTVVMVIQIAGLILVIALLTIPPMLAELFTDTLWKTMALATLSSLFFCLTGLAISYHLDLTSGASIIAVATAG